MISNFSFESPVEFKPTNWPSAQAIPPNAVALQVPLEISNDILNLNGIESNVSALLEHFAPLRIAWMPELDEVRGGLRLTGRLESRGSAGSVWILVILECASIARHTHHAGGAYGECIMTLAGELDDIQDDGTEVKLRSGSVIFHAANTTHEPSTERFWVGLCHQPQGSTGAK